MFEHHLFVVTKHGMGSFVMMVQRWSCRCPFQWTWKEVMVQQLWMHSTCKLTPKTEHSPQHYKPHRWTTPLLSTMPLWSGEDLWNCLVYITFSFLCKHNVFHREISDQRRWWFCLMRIVLRHIKNVCRFGTCVVVRWQVCGWQWDSSELEENGNRLEVTCPAGRLGILDNRCIRTDEGYICLCHWFINHH